MYPSSQFYICVVLIFPELFERKLETSYYFMVKYFSMTMSILAWQSPKSKDIFFKITHLRKLTKKNNKKKERKLTAI